MQIKTISISAKISGLDAGFHIGTFNVYDTTDLRYFAAIKCKKHALSKVPEYGQEWLDKLESVTVYTTDPEYAELLNINCIESSDNNPHN